MNISLFSMSMQNQLIYYRNLINRFTLFKYIIFFFFFYTGQPMPNKCILFSAYIVFTLWWQRRVASRWWYGWGRRWMRTNFGSSLSATQSCRLSTIEISQNRCSMSELSSENWGGPIKCSMSGRFSFKHFFFTFILCRSPHGLVAPQHDIMIGNNKYRVNISALSTL